MIEYRLEKVLMSSQLLLLLLYLLLAVVRRLLLALLVFGAGMVMVVEMVDVRGGAGRRAVQVLRGASYAVPAVVAVALQHCVARKEARKHVCCLCVHLGVEPQLANA